MDPADNPYSPGAGRIPTELVGRSAELMAWETALKRINHGRDAQSVVLYGLRGVGKTVLLNRFAHLAQESKWMVAKVEAKAGKQLRDRVGEAFHDDLVDLARPGVGTKILKALKTALSFKASYDSTGSWSFGLDLESAPGGGADTGRLETDLGKFLRDLCSAAKEKRIGVALLVDEAQELSEEELVAICAITHAAHQSLEPLVVALAGLPSLPRKLAEAKSYAERLFHYHVVDRLSVSESEKVLEAPAAIEGVQWEDQALRYVASQARGYPYFLQQFGQETWNLAGVSPITVSEAKAGVIAGQHVLDTGFFRIRWDRATQAEKDYLCAMAPDGDGGSSTSALAMRLHKKASALGPTRASLIGKGLIYSPDHGVVAYTVPSMADFVLRQPRSEA